MNEDEQLRLLVNAFSDSFLRNERYETIVSARKYAEAILQKKVDPGTAEAKFVDEAIEKGMVRAAKAITQSAESSELVYERLVDLYERQPTLGVRSSTSVSQQAYTIALPSPLLI